MKIIIYSPTPLLEVDKNDSHRLNVSGAGSRAKIDLCIIKGGYWSHFMEGIDDENVNMYFEGLEPGIYFIYQTPIYGPGSGIKSQFTSNVTIVD